MRITTAKQKNVMPNFEDDEAYELRLARRQWLSPDRKEQVMGKLKEMVFNYDLMNAQQIFGVLNHCNLLGFGHASYMDLENLFGPPAVGEDAVLPDPVIEYDEAGNKWAVHHPDPSRAMRFSVLRPFRSSKERGAITCAWGILWEDKHGVVIHDLNPATDRYEDTKHWHVTGTREGWYRLNHCVIDPICVRLESVEKA